MNAEKQQAPRFPSYEKEIRECDAIFDGIRRTISRQRGYVVDTGLLTRAYERARELHGDTRRKSGVLSLRHPLAVMEELSHLMCKTSILAAALLHDTMEDCRARKEVIREDFSAEIAEIVDAVTAIKKKEAAQARDLADHYAAMTPAEQHEFLDRLTDAKLISSRYQKEAFLVRFADRAHNLSTIDACAPGKRMEKIAATRQFLIPAARRLGMRYFDIILSDFCMKYDGEDFSNNESARIRAERNSLTRAGGPIYSRFDQILQEAVTASPAFTFPRFNPFAQLRGVKREGEDWMKATHRRILLAHEIRSQLEAGAPFERSRLDLWEILLTCRSASAGENLSAFLALHRAWLRPEGISLEYRGQEDNTLFLRLTDRYENNYRIVLVPDSELEAYFIGDPRGEKLTMIDEEAPGDALRPQMTVYSYSPGRGIKKHEKCVPYGATALDFAFIVSKAMAGTVKGAWIHQHRQGEPMPPFREDDYEFPLKTVLNEGDVVYFDADYVPGDGQGSIHHASIDWFAEINTEYAKMCLIRYFKEKMRKQTDPA